MLLLTCSLLLKENLPTYQTLHDPSFGATAMHKERDVQFMNTVGPW